MDLGNTLKKNNSFSIFINIVMKDNTRKECVMAKGNKWMKIKMFSKDYGKTIKKLKKESFNFQIILSMRVKSKMKHFMVKDALLMKIKMNILDNSIKENIMVKEN